MRVFHLHGRDSPTKKWQFCYWSSMVLLLLLTTTTQWVSGTSVVVTSKVFTTTNNNNNNNKNDRMLNVRGGGDAVWEGLRNSMASAMAAASSKTLLAPFDTIKTIQQQELNGGSPLSFSQAAKKICSRPQGFLELYVSLFFFFFFHFKLSLEYYTYFFLE